ncbi:MAG: hypothetical protein HC890_04990 [Chloroflexaceae bacterium]|nr:hypothetical protein [Chloroflexaceae bacterium]
MAQRLKRWESPRREGRNDKGKGGSARARQLKKRQQMLRKQLQEGHDPKQAHKSSKTDQGREPNLFLFYLVDFLRQKLDKLPG